MHNDEKVLRSVDEYLRHQKLKKKMRNIFLVIFLFIIFVLLFLLYSPVLNILEIEYEGLNRYDEDYIQSITQIYEGQNILKINDKEVINRLKSDIYIKDAVIERQFPSKLKIVITEREPFAVVLVDNSYLVLDKETRVLECLSDEVEGYPLINGIELDGSFTLSNALGNVLGVSNTENKDVAFLILNSAFTSEREIDGENKSFISTINCVDVSDLNNVVLTVDEIYKVDFGKSSEFKKETILYRFELLSDLLERVKGKSVKINMSESLISNKSYIITEEK